MRADPPAPSHPVTARAPAAPLTPTGAALPSLAVGVPAPNPTGNEPHFPAAVAKQTEAEGPFGSAPFPPETGSGF